MEDLNLTETEMRYFGDLFLCCDEESNGKIPILKATELFRSSNVPNDVLKQIMDISVAPSNCASLNHMNRKQFYSSLKLIAAHQQNMPLKPELLSSALDLPLPRFTWTLNSEASADLIQLSNSPKEQHIPKRDRNFTSSSVGAYEPIRISSNLSDSDVPQTLSHEINEALSTDSDIESEPTSQRSESRGRRVKSGSPWSTASESPTPTNSVAERVHPVWEHSATGRGVWPANTGEEHTQLLGTEEESSDRHSSEDEAEGAGSGSGSGGGGGGGGGAGDAIWGVSPAQARHYAAQFAQLRPERGLLPGPVARLFFEKSRLSVTDLRKIWQLSDINKDGALSLEEFSIAMHLIVLRRNRVPVPAALPPRLAPRSPPAAPPAPAAAGTDLVDLGADMFGSGTSADFNFAEPEERRAEPTPPREPPPNKEWTKFVDSPTSSVSSPGPKPVNFDFQKATVERDPKIYHPVALRVTPDAGAAPTAAAADEPRRDDFAHAFELASPKRLGSQPPGPPADPPNGVAEIKSIQRPQPKKPLKTAGALPPPPAPARDVTHGEDGPASLQPVPRKEPPPPPPPRPLRHHARSSSLDLTRLGAGGGGSGVATGAPPPLPPPSPPPPRRLPAQRSEGEGYEGEGFGYTRAAAAGDEAPRMQGAFEVYRRGGGSRSRSPERPEPGVKALLEQNAVLHRVCRALQAELADAQREREALRARLQPPPAPAPAPLAPLAPLTPLAPAAEPAPAPLTPAP